jgi:hypothetical protein
MSVFELIELTRKCEELEASVAALTAENERYKKALERISCGKGSNAHNFNVAREALAAEQEKK